MLGNHFDIRQMFADQFESDAQGIVYRKYMKGAPIRVSAAERDRYVSTFNRYIKYASWGGTGATIILCLSLVFYTMAVRITLPRNSLIRWFERNLRCIHGGLLLELEFARARIAQSWHTMGEVRSRAPLRQLFLERLTYGQIAAGGSAGVILLLRANASGGILSGWNILWAGLAATLFVLCAVQAFRKWRFESQR